MFEISSEVEKICYNGSSIGPETWREKNLIFFFKWAIYSIRPSKKCKQCDFVIRPFFYFIFTYDTEILTSGSFRPTHFDAQ